MTLTTLAEPPGCILQIGDNALPPVWPLCTWDKQTATIAHNSRATFKARPSKSLFGVNLDCQAQVALIMSTTGGHLMRLQ